MSSNSNRRLEMNLRMFSKWGIIAFTVFGVVIFSIVFLAAAFTSPKPMALWKLLVYGIGGALSVGAFFGAMLYSFKKLLVDRFSKNR